MSTFTRDPDDLRDLLGAYALDAVDADERAEIEALLKDDPTARADVSGMRSAAERTLRTAGGPSPETWQGILTAIDSGDHRARNVVPIAAVQPRQPRRVVRIVAAATAVAAAATFALLATGGGDGGTGNLPAEPVSSVERAARAALRTVGAERVHLVTDDGASAADLVLLPGGSGYVLDGSGTSTDGVYRLLAITDHGTVLVAVIGDSLKATAFDLPAGTVSVVLARGEDVLASATAPLGLVPAATATTAGPTVTPGQPTSPTLLPGVPLTLPNILPTLPNGALDLGLLNGLLGQ